MEDPHSTEMDMAVIVDRTPQEIGILYVESSLFGRKRKLLMLLLSSTMHRNCRTITAALLSRIYRYCIGLAHPSTVNQQQ